MFNISIINDIISKDISCSFIFLVDVYNKMIIYFKLLITCELWPTAALFHFVIYNLYILLFFFFFKEITVIVLLLYTKNY